MAGQLLLTMSPGQPTVGIVHVSWHTVQVYKGGQEAVPPE
jgi:hypothetical protein